MAIIPIPDCGKGVNKDLLPSELDLGVWSDCSQFRFANGFAEKFQGVVAKTVTGFEPYWLTSFVTSSTRFQIEAGIAKVYAFDGSTRTEITRYTDGVAITSITFVGTTATVTTSSAHGRTTGNTVTHFGATESLYNGTFVITVTGATTYTYTMTGTPSANATVVGQYSYNVTSNFTGAIDDRWTGGVLNGILIMNNPVDGLYYWNGDITTRLRKVPGAYVADAARIFKNYIVQLAATVSGVKNPHSVAWGAAAEPGSLPSSFTSAPTNDAGIVALAETSGPMIDALQLGDVFILYKQDARYSMQYVGGNDVFRFVRLPGADGIFARHCVTDTPKGHVFLSQRREAMIHQGGIAQSLSVGRMKNWMNDQIAQSSYVNRMFVVANNNKTEVWFAVSTGSTAVDTVYVWNWNDDTWGIFSFTAANLTHGHSGLWPTNLTTNDGLMVTTAALGGQVGYVDPTGNGFIFGNTNTGTLERTGIHLGDHNSIKMLNRSRWNYTYSSSATFTTYHGAKMFSGGVSGGTTTYAASGNYDPTNYDFFNSRGPSGRYLAIKMSTTAAAASLRSIDLDVTTAGTR